MRINNYIIIFVFLVFITLPWPVWMLMGNEGYDFGLSDEDNMPFKGSIEYLYANLLYKGFNSPVTDRGILGKDGWLFYNAENSLDDYNGGVLYEKPKLEELVNNLESLDDTLGEQKIETYYVIIPNKERIYSEYMPEIYGKPAENYRTKTVVDYVEKNSSIDMIYLYNSLISAKKNLQDEEIYYKTDTHWNELGAYYGAMALKEQLGWELNSLESVDIKKTDYSSGDLKIFMKLEKVKLEDYGYEIFGFSQYTIVDEEDRSLEKFKVNSNNPNGKKCLVVRDSFATALMDCIACNYAETYFVHWNSFEMQDIENYNPDVVIFETLERYSDRFFKLKI